MSSIPLAEQILKLRAQLAERDRDVVALRTELATRDRAIGELLEALRLARRQRFGASSEQTPDDQARLFDEAEVTADPACTADDDTVESAAKSELPAAEKSARRRGKRAPLPASLPRVEVIHDLPEAERVCPHDGTPLTEIGAEISEQLQFIPATVQVIRHIRKKYACRHCEQHLAIAEKPPQPIEKSFATPSLLSFVAVSKFADALPLYRQSAIFERFGIDLDRTTLANWMIRCGELVQPLINRLHEQLSEALVVYADETPVQVLKEAGRAAQTKSYMWVAVTGPPHPVVLFHYAPSRGAEVARAWLGDLRRTLMVDGYESYESLVKANQVTRLGCWAHARRKFKEAQRAQVKGKTGKADVALNLIGKLYRVETQGKDLPASARLDLRQSDAKPVLDALRRWLDQSLPQTAPKTTLGKALHYLAAQWPRLIRYVDHGAYPIDNNRAENAIRPFVVGRKNWLFSNSVAGAKASANLYGLIETAKANGLEPYAYLQRVFSELPKASTVEDIDVLLPFNVQR